MLESRDECLIFLCLWLWLSLCYIRHARYLVENYELEDLSFKLHSSSESVAVDLLGRNCDVAYHYWSDSSFLETRLVPLHFGSEFGDIW